MDHTHCHDFEEAPRQAPKGQTQLVIVLLLSGSYMVAEIIGSFLSGSLALLADAGHMAVDTGAVALGLFAIWIAKKPASDKKTFGYYRAEILAALFNSLALLGVSFFILSEAWERFMDPPEVQGLLMTVVAAGGLVVNLIALKLTHSHSHHSLNMKAVWLHIMGDTLGSVSAVIAAVLVWQFQWYPADPILSAGLAVFIIYGATKLLIECVNVLLEGTPSNMDVNAVKETLSRFAEVDSVHDLHLWQVTNKRMAFTAHVRVKEGVSHGRLLRKMITALHDTYGIFHVTLQLEPPDFADRIQQEPF